MHIQEPWSSASSTSYIIFCILYRKIFSLGSGSCENDTFPKDNYLKNSSWFMSHSLTPFYYCATISNILAAICGYWQHITFIDGILKESTNKVFWDKEFYDRWLCYTLSWSNHFFQGFISYRNIKITIRHYRVFLYLTSKIMIKYNSITK